MKKSLNFYTIYYTIIFIATEVLALYVALKPTEGEFVMDNGTLIALLGVGGVIIGGIINAWRDLRKAKLQGDETRSDINNVNTAVKDVKSDTNHIKPEIDNINKNTDKIRDEVIEKIIPSLKEFENASSKINDIHKDMEYKQRINNETSWDLFSKDRFIGGIEKLYEENAKLTNENRNLKVELTDKELKLKSLEAELKVVREENEKLKATQTPTKSYDSMTQDFSL